MNVLIVEDEMMAQKSLTRLLTTNFTDIDIVGYTNSVKGTVTWLNTPTILSTNHTVVVVHPVTIVDYYVVECKVIL